MNNLTLTFLVGCVVLLFTAQRTEGVRCYTCLGCKDPFDKSKATIINDCKSCSKIKINDLVTKVCSPIKMDDKCNEASGTFTCGCSSELCNGSTNITPSTMVIGALTAGYLLFKKF